MKKISVCAAIAAVAVGLLTATAAAQNTQLAKATIPFSFSVHETQFPAGEYEVRHLGDSLLRLQRLSDGKGVTLIAPSAIRESAGLVLTFRQYGDRSFLAAISDPTHGYVQIVPKSQGEREMQASRKGTVVALKAAH